MKLHSRILLLALGLLLGALGWHRTALDAQAARAWRTATGAHRAPTAAPLATNIVVNSTADGMLAVLAANATCDLREAIAAANTNAVVGQCPAGMAGLDTISFSVTGTIGLTAGDLTLSEAVTITGPGANVLAVSGSNLSRVFSVNGVTATISGLTITGGNGVGAVSSGEGGGIFNFGNLTLTASHVTGNTAGSLGGGIRNSSGGTLTVERSAVTSNTANFNITTSGGIVSSGTLFVTNSTVSGNRVTVAASTTGGGILSNGTATITASTITDNEAAGPNTVGGVLAFSGTVTVRNTIIAANRNNTTTPDVGVFGTGTFTSQGYNLIGNPGTVMAFNQTGDQVGTMATPLNPVLGPLTNNGGPTPTQRPLTGSPAIDQGNSFGLTTDQRGSLRPVDNPALANAPGGDGSDSGAVELRAVESGGMITLTINPASDPAGAVTELLDAINAANSDPAPTTINLVCGVYTLTTRSDPFNYYGFNGLPVITSPITIQGNGAVIERSTATGTPTFRLFAVAKQDPTTGAPLATPGSLTLDQVSLRGGLAQGGRGGASGSTSGGGGGAGLGGAIYNQGTLVVRRSALTQNTAQGGAGGSNIGGSGASEGGGGGGLGGNGGDSTINTDGGSGGGGFGGTGGTGALGDDGGGGGGGTMTPGSAGSGATGGAGGTANGGAGGNDSMTGANGGFGGGGGGDGGGGGEDDNGGNGGVGGGGGGGSFSGGGGGDGGFGAGGGGAAPFGFSGDGGFGGGGGGGGGFGPGGGGLTGGSSAFAGGFSGSGIVAGGGGGAGLGGAVFNDSGALTLINSTLSGNAAIGGAGGAGRGAAQNGGAGQGLGGAVFARNGTVTINNATFNNNSVTTGAGATVANGGGALYLLGDSRVVRPGDLTAVTFNVSNSLFANTPGGASDAFVNTINAGTAAPGTNNNNLVEVNGSTPGADSNDLPGVTKTADPQLGQLTMANCAASGCRTPVHPITVASPAFNMAGGNAELVDQCGTTRPTGFADIGAFELPASAPTLSKAFNPMTIAAGGTSTLTITLTNPNTIALPGASVTDTLPLGLTTVAGTAATNCGGMATQTANSVSLSGGTIPASGSCTLSVGVTGTTGGTFTNTIPAGALVSNGGTNAAPASAVLTVVAPPTLTKSFNPTTINAGASSQITLTFANPAGNAALTNLAVTDNLPAGVSIAATPPPGFNTCGGTVTGATAGSSSFSLSGGMLAAGASCQVQVNVTSSTPGPVTNTTTAPTATGGGVPVTGASASAQLTVNPIQPPTISKVFGAPTISLGGMTSLTLTINNPNPSLALTGVAFTDTLPAGLVVATPNGLTNSCGGTVTAVSGAGTISLSSGTIAAGGACTVTVNVMGTSLGAKGNSVTITSTNGGTGNTTTATVMVTAVRGAPVVTIVDPFGCTGPGDVLTVTVMVTNPALVAQTVAFTSTLPTSLVGLPGTGTSTVGATPAVTAGNASFGPTVLGGGQTVTATYQVQVGDAMSGAQLCINTTATFSGAPGPAVQACTTVNCPPVGPGLPFPSTAEVSDQKAGSVLVYNLYASNAASPNTQNTRLAITNTNPTSGIAVHLFFVDGATCSIADAIICLTQNQTASFLASDLDPGTTGYVVAVASDPTTGCPINFNFLIGDAYVKLASGHQANLGAEAFAALAGAPVACDGNSLAAQLNFDGVSYNRAPRTLAASSIPARIDGNDTLLVVNRFGGDLAVGAATLSNLFGILHDDAENALSFTFNPGVCQFRSSLTNDFLRTTPRIETFIPAGRSGWLRLYSASDIGLLGAILNYNPTAQTNARAFNQGRNLHKLTMTSTQTLVIPIFPPNCLN